jgi:hypothetical protein
MAKFGKKNMIKDGIFSYSIFIIGESGIGKTTLMKDVCEKVVGDDGYLLLNIGREDGVDAIQGIVYEDAPDWKTFSAIINDIVDNKDADYPDLKVVIIDTIDQLFEIAEPEIIRLHNIENKEKKVTSIKAAFGGFMAGEDRAIDLVLDKLWALKTVGVQFAIVGHVKKRDVEDVVTGQTYSTLTTNMSQRYFNAIKTKVHLLGVASVDREIIKEKTGKKNIVTKEDQTRGRIVSESRRITFRDDNYTIDSKSRFKDIVPSIPLDADAFISAVNDAILASKNGEGVSPPIAPKRAAPVIQKEDPEVEIDPEIAATNESIEDYDTPVEETLNKIRSKFKDAQKPAKSKVKQILGDAGFDVLGEDVPAETLKKILAVLS